MGQVIIKTAFDEAATAAGLEQIVQNISAEISPRDTFVLVRCGPWLLENTGAFICLPQDYQGGPILRQLTSRSDRSGASAGLDRQHQARRGVILLDTCEAEGADKQLCPLPH